ncbi:MAG: type VI secretion system tip protein TssI/VgrG [Polyangiaceae bacterium]
MGDQHRVRKATVQLPSGAFEVANCRGSERVSAPFEYRVRVLGPADALTAIAPGVSAQLLLSDELSAPRSIRGLVGEIAVSASSARTSCADLLIVPLTRPLELAHTSRAYVDMSAIEIATQLLSSHGVPFRLELRRDYPRSPYRAQRAESDWGYLLRLLGEVGIYLWFDHDADSAVVLADHSPAAFAITLPVLRDTALSDEIEWVTALGPFVAQASTSVATQSFSWKNPSLALNAIDRAPARRSAADGGPSPLASLEARTPGPAGSYESYDAPGGGPATPSATSAVVAHGAELAALARGGGVGRARSLRVFPGRALHADETLDSDGQALFIISTSLELADASDKSFAVSFEAAPLASPYRAPAPPSGSRLRRGGAGHAGGLSYGVVVASDGDEVYPSADGRVRVQMHWDREGKRDEHAGTWMRVAQRGAPGSMMYPRTGWVVATLHEEGSADCPLVLSRIHDGEHPPAYSLPENKTRVVYKTATTPGGGSFNELHFEDRLGAENVYWHASRDMVISTDANKTERIERDALHRVGRDQRVTTGRDHSLSVRNDQHHSVAAHEKIKTGAGRTTAVGGSESVRIGGSRNLHAHENVNLNVEETRKLKVGAAALEVSLGQMSASSEDALLLVGGAVLRASKKNVTDATAEVAMSIVGGVALELAAENRTTQVDGDFTEIVGEDLQIQSGGRVTEAADETADFMVGGTLSLEAKKEIRVGAKDSIKLVCGSSSIVMTPSGIELCADAIQLAGSKLDIQTKLVKHNS